MKSTLKNLTIKDLSELIRNLKAQIEDDYRAFEEDTILGIQLTIGYDPDKSDWDYQTGDNCFVGNAYRYPLWAVAGIYRNSNSREVAKDIINQIADQVAQ